MIVYHHPTSVQPPAFLQGARDLSARQSVRGGCFFGIGPSYLCGFNEESEGEQLADGWKVKIIGTLDPFVLRRERPGQPLIPMPDMEGRMWGLPMILNSVGRRAFPVRYDKQCKPILSKEQQQLHTFAQEAPELIAQLTAPDANLEELVPAAMKCTLASIAYGNHISEEVASVLGVADSTLIMGALIAMCSYDDERGNA